MTDSYDFAVIGGGLVGTAIARGLARSGLRVVLLDEGDQAFRASRGNFALVWLQSKGLGLSAYANWTRASVELWPQFATELAEETGINVALQQPGGFQLALSETEMERLVLNAEKLNRQPDIIPYPYEALDGTAVRRRLPAVGPDVVGGIYCPLDGHVNALRLFKAMHYATARAGVDYRADHRVANIVAGDNFTLYSPGRETIAAKRLVLAAGLDIARLAPMVGLEIPVRPQRGQILVTEKTAPFLDFPISTVRQTDEGSVLLGDSQEESGFDDETGTGVLSVIAERAVRMFPQIKDLNVVRSWACLRVLSPDGFPIYAESVLHPGAFVATCHSGVTLAAAHSKLLSPAIAASRLPEKMRSFTPARFNVQTTA